MKVEKKVIGRLNKCYSIAPLFYQGREHFLVAAEKQDPCYLFDLDGKKVDTVWEGPGGVMSMAQVPGTDGQFLATHQFYSPNDSGEAKIVVATPKSGKWEIRTLLKLPHVHRFDILTRGGERYLIACTLKSGHEYKEDWTKPGKVYGALLPSDLTQYSEEHPLQMKVLKDNLLRNHGYYRMSEQGTDTALVSSEEGIFQFTPPEKKGADWTIRKLSGISTSDAVCVDLDEDGEKEIASLAPFHGEQIKIYKKKNGVYEEEVYSYPQPAQFSHAIYGGPLCGRPAFVAGHRKGRRELLAFTYAPEKKTYEVQVLDSDCGPANVFHYVRNGKDVLISTNREIDEIAMYTLEP